MELNVIVKEKNIDCNKCNILLSNFQCPHCNESIFDKKIIISNIHNLQFGHWNLNKLLKQLYLYYPFL